MLALEKYLEILCLWHNQLTPHEGDIDCTQCGEELYELRKCLSCQEVYALDPEEQGIVIEDELLCLDCAGKARNTEGDDIPIMGPCPATEFTV